uniref:Uncharacterized protein n=1 Tax=Mustela putorius furo TaxID=9669 RepID=M3Y1R2_MUSPF
MATPLKDPETKISETYKLPKLKREEIENLNRFYVRKEIESIMKCLPTNKKSRAGWLLRRITLDI